MYIFHIFRDYAAWSSAGFEYCWSPKRNTFDWPNIDCASGLLSKQVKFAGERGMKGTQPPVDSGTTAIINEGARDENGYRPYVSHWYQCNGWFSFFILFVEECGLALGWLAEIGGWNPTKLDRERRNGQAVVVIIMVGWLGYRMIGNWFMVGITHAISCRSGNLRDFGAPALGNGWMDGSCSNWLSVTRMISILEW